MYVRVNCTVSNKGWLVPFEEVDAFRREHIKKHKADADKDWYVSPFMYGSEALEYYKSEIKDDSGTIKKPRNSMAGYSGESWPSMLYWDFDCEGNFKKTQDNTIKLLEYISKLKLIDCTNVYFSGSKGFHITIDIADKIDQKTLLKIVRGIAKDAGIDKEVFDTSVYNITRIFRMPNTKHQKSGLFKIPLYLDEVYDLKPSEIKEKAENTRELDLEPPEYADITELLNKYNVEEKEIIVTEEERDKFEVLNEFSDIIVNDTERRRCIQLLEQGEFGPGERNSALVRLASYYKHEGIEESVAYDRINKAFEARAKKFPEANPIDDKETLATLQHVYSPKWEGGIFSCHKDEFLQNICSNGKNCCMMKKGKALGKNVQDIGGLFKNYILYGNEADETWPEFGLENIDSMVRIRPKNYSIIAGANGSGKTSLILEMMDKLNEQGIPHLFFSLDMADSSLFEKLAAKYTQYNLSDIERVFSVKSRRVGIMREIGETLKEMMPYTYFDFTSSANMTYIRDTIRNLNKDLPTPIKVVFIDYAGRLSGEGESQYANATANALMANDVAKDTNTHIMFIAQISRQHGDHTDPVRNNRVAKESGAWEENATFVMTVWRPFGKGTEGVPDKYMVTYVGKNRTGRLGECYFTWNGKKGTVAPMVDQEIEEYAKLCERFGMDPPMEYARSKINSNKKSDRLGNKARRNEEP